jgi:hypothetical protein
MENEDLAQRKIWPKERLASFLIGGLHLGPSEFQSGTFSEANEGEDPALLNDPFEDSVHLL